MYFFGIHNFSKSTYRRGKKPSSSFSSVRGAWVILSLRSFTNREFFRGNQSRPPRNFDVFCTLFFSSAVSGFCKIMILKKMNLFFQQFRWIYKFWSQFSWVSVIFLKKRERRTEKKVVFFVKRKQLKMYKILYTFGDFLIDKLCSINH